MPLGLFPTQLKIDLYVRYYNLLGKLYLENYITTEPSA
jgi:hypothetical protein